MFRAGGGGRRGGEGPGITGDNTGGTPVCGPEQCTVILQINIAIISKRGLLSYSTYMHVNYTIYAMIEYLTTADGEGGGGGVRILN